MAEEHLPSLWEVGSEFPTSLPEIFQIHNKPTYRVIIQYKEFNIFEQKLFC